MCVWGNPTPNKKSPQTKTNTSHKPEENHQTGRGQHYPDFSETQSIGAYRNLSFTE